MRGAEGERWDGNLHHFATRVWPEPCDVAAIVVAGNGQARLWMNAEHVAGEVGWLVWLWGRERARAGGVAVLYADELPTLHQPPEAQRVRS